MIITVLSYNIHRAIGIDRRFRPNRIIDILSHHQADVVLLQEVDHFVPRSRNTDMAKDIASALGYPHYAIGLNVKLRSGHYGNATFSRLPISGERNIDLTVGANKRRGCLYTRVHLPKGDGSHREMSVFNLHLGLSAQERARQVGMLVRSREYSTLDPGGACVIAGDFNDWRNLLPPVFQDILGFACATSSARRDHYGAGLRTFPSFSPSGELDRIYWRGPLRLVGARKCRLQVSRIASDHLPVIAKFEI